MIFSPALFICIHCAWPAVCPREKRKRALAFCIQIVDVFRHDYLLISYDFVYFYDYFSFQLAPRQDDSSDDEDDDEEEGSKEGSQETNVALRRDDYANDDDDYIL